MLYYSRIGLSSARNVIDLKNSLSSTQDGISAIKKNEVEEKAKSRNVMLS